MASDEVTRELREIQRLLQCLIDKDKPASPLVLTDGLKQCAVCLRKYQVVSVLDRHSDRLEPVVTEVTTFDDRINRDATRHSCRWNLVDAQE